MKISTFRQGPTEAFKDAWIRFKSYQRDCPHHGFSDVQLLGIFFRGIDWRHQTSLDSASKGNFNTNFPRDALALIENMASSSSTKNIDYERKMLGKSADGGNMAKMEAKLDSVHNLLVGKKQVQFAQEVETFIRDEGENEEDCNYVGGSGFQGQRFGNQQGYRNYGGNNYSGNNQRPTFTGNQANPSYTKPQFQNTDYQKPYQSSFTRNYGSSSYQTPPPKSSDDKRDSMLEQILEGQQKMTVNFNGKLDALYTDLNGKIESIHLHVKKLDTQVAQQAETVKRQEGFLPARTETNPRLHMNAITMEKEDEGEADASPSIDNTICRSTAPEQSYTVEAEGHPSIDIPYRRSTQAEQTQIPHEPYTRRSTDIINVDRHEVHDLASPSESSDVPVERVYKPKVPYPRRTDMSKQELEDALCKAITDKLVEDNPIINGDSFYPVVGSCLRRRSTQGWSKAQFTAVISEKVEAEIKKMTPKEPPQPTLKTLPKLAYPGRFVFPCSINGFDLHDSLCDTGASVNVMSMDLAKKLGILDLERPRASIRLANSSSTRPKGFIPDLMLQIGECLVPADFHVIEMKEDNDDPLIVGRVFLNTVGAIVDFPNVRISFSKVDKDIYYPAVLDEEISSCTSVRFRGRPNLDLKDYTEKKEDGLKVTLPATQHEVTKPARPKCKKAPKVPLKTPPPPRSDGDSIPAKGKRKGSKRAFSNIRIIVPLAIREKGEEVVQEMLQNTAKLFPGAFPRTIPLKI